MIEIEFCILFRRYIDSSQAKQGGKPNPTLNNELTRQLELVAKLADYHDLERIQHICTVQRV